MDFALNEEQKMLVDTIRSFIAKELAPLEDEIETTGVLRPELARAVHEKAKALGLYAMNIPVEFGGGGLSAVDHMLAEEQFGRTTDILDPPRLRQRLRDAARVQGRADRALAEARRDAASASLRSRSPSPAPGSDAAGIKTRAVRDGDGWRLTGNKHFISDGAVSDFFLVTAVTDPTAGAKGISMFLVDKGLPGFTIGRDQPMMGIRGTSHVELFFDTRPLEPIALLGREGEGLKLALVDAGPRAARAGRRARDRQGDAWCSTRRSPTRASASSSARRSANSRWCSR